jgi:hypothetical protein
MSTRKTTKKNPAPSTQAKTGAPQEWEIKGRGDTCIVSGRAFTDGEPFWSRLVFNEQGYMREDYAEAHWTDELRKSSVSSWKSFFRLPPPPEPEPLKKESAEAALRKLMAEEDPANANSIFVLAVMLERKKTLVEKDVQIREGQPKIRIYEHKLTGEAFLIPDPELKLSELGRVQEEVAQRLGWNQKAATVNPGASS